MIHPLSKFKEEQKQLVAKIKKDHDTYDSYQARHNHIAYCELRGTPRNKIELPREGNEPNEYSITRIKQKWQPDIDAWNQWKDGLNA